MSTPTSLYLPIDVEAFCVGAFDERGKNGSTGTQGFARFSNDFSKLPYKNRDGQIQNGKKAAVGSIVYPGFFQENPENGGMKTGIHLHWALPDALAHGEADESGHIEFREAPNRWLVVRILKDTKATDGNPDLSAWVVASDQLWDRGSDTPNAQNHPSQAVPVIPLEGDSGNKAFRELGRVHNYAEWTEPGAANAFPRTTAVGYGEPTFAAAYAHSQNVFGFYDPLEQHTLDDSTKEQSWEVAYFVSGWYSDPQSDPITRLDLPAGASYADKMAQLKATYKWAFPPVEGADFPSHTFCHGLIYNLEWNPSRVYVKSRPKSKVKVAIGNNTAEALSALIANQAGNIDTGHLETTLNLLQQGLLAQIDQPGGLGAAEEKIHEATFGRVAAGPMWLVKRKDADKAQRQQRPKDPAKVQQQQADIANSLLKASATNLAALPKEVAILLDTLNEQQIGVDRLLKELESRRGQLFVDWYKYMVLEYPQTGSFNPDNSIDVNKAYDYLQTEAGDIAGDNYDDTGGQMALLNQLTEGITVLKEAIASAIKATNSKDLELVKVEAPRYWQPHDPVVMVSGVDLEAPQRHGGDGRFDEQGCLLCRVSGQLVSSMNVSGKTVGTAQLPPLTGPARPPVYTEELGKLLDEAFFLLPQDGLLLATAAGDISLASDIVTAQANFLSGQKNPDQVINFSGNIPSSLAMKDWGGAEGENPWIPLMMQWRVDFDPVMPIKPNNRGGDTAYPEDLITSNFKADDAAMAVELVSNKPPGEWTSRQSYEGGILLSTNTEISIREQASAFIKNYPEDENTQALKEFLDYLKTNRLPNQSQALSGFNEALLMRELGMQMPVNDPLSPGGLHERFINGELPKVIGRMNINAPMPLNYFNPLRAGNLKISKIRIIDAFGQYQDIDSPEMIISHNLQPVMASEDNLVALPPRITQPSRLMFRWQSALDDSLESNSHPATTPVFGWVLFNHLDDSLAVYDGEGNALGSFNLRGPVWQSAPGHEESYGTTDPSLVLKGLTNTPANVHLKHFVNGVYAKIKDGKLDYLEAMLAAIDRSVTTIDPSRAKQHQGLSVLVGRPLALTRASLKLELDGLPALDQSWSAFKNTINEDTPLPYESRETAGFTKVKFPVQIGDLSKMNDGLIGYFTTDKADSRPEDYNTFYAPAIVHTDHIGKGVEAPGFDHLQLTPSYGIITEAGEVNGVNYKKVTSQTTENSQYLTMLVDPRAAIHATTGILPTKSIEIPPDLYADALANLAVTFLTAPLLTSSHKLAIPLPKEEGFAWSWITNENNNWSANSKIATVNPRAAFDYPPVVVEEGWLQLRAKKEGSSS